MTRRDFLARLARTPSTSTAIPGLHLTQFYYLSASLNASSRCLEYEIRKLSFQLIMCSVSNVNGAVKVQVHVAGQLGKRHQGTHILSM